MYVCMWKLTFAEQKISLCLVPPPHGALHSPEGPVVQAYPPEEPECSIIYVKKYCKNLSFKKLKRFVQDWMCVDDLMVFLSLHLSSWSIQIRHPDSPLGTTPTSLL